VIFAFNCGRYYIVYCPWSAYTSGVPIFQSPAQFREFMEDWK